MLDDDRDSPSNTVGDSGGPPELVPGDTLFGVGLSTVVTDGLLELALPSLFSVCSLGPAASFRLAVVSRLGFRYPGGGGGGGAVGHSLRSRVGLAFVIVFLVRLDEDGEAALDLRFGFTERFGTEDDVDERPICCQESAAAASSEGFRP